jgi:hypothetical protein
MGHSAAASTIRAHPDPRFSPSMLDPGPVAKISSSRLLLYHHPRAEGNVGKGTIMWRPLAAGELNSVLPQTMGA